MGLNGNGQAGGLFIFITTNCLGGCLQALEEAAYVDGAGHLKAFFRIMLPNAKPHCH